jgi:hypothetical protein
LRAGDGCGQAAESGEERDGGVRGSLLGLISWVDNCCGYFVASERRVN